MHHDGKEHAVVDGIMSRWRMSARPSVQRAPFGRHFTMFNVVHDHLDDPPSSFSASADLWLCHVFEIVHWPTGAADVSVDDLTSVCAGGLLFEFDPKNLDISWEFDRRAILRKAQYSTERRYAVHAPVRVGAQAVVGSQSSVQTDVHLNPGGAATTTILLIIQP